MPKPSEYFIRRLSSLPTAFLSLDFHFYLGLFSPCRVSLQVFWASTADSSQFTTVPTEVRAKYIAIIDSILDNADLTTISAKRIRSGIQDRVEYDITPQKVGNHKWCLVWTLFLLLMIGCY